MQTNPHRVIDELRNTGDDVLAAAESLHTLGESFRHLAGALQLAYSELHVDRSITVEVDDGPTLRDHEVEELVPGALTSGAARALEEARARNEARSSAEAVE